MTKTSNSFRFIKPLKYLRLEEKAAHHLLRTLCIAADNDTGQCWHSMESLTYLSFMKIDSVRKAAKYLVELGVITRESGVKRSLLYTVDHDKLVELANKSKAGRREFILGCREQRASRQKRWRDAARGCKQVDVDTKRGVYTELVDTKPDVLCRCQSGCLRRYQSGTPNY